MNFKLFIKKQLLERVIPKSLLYRLLTIYWQQKAKKARQVFGQASKAPAWLEKETLFHLQQLYSPRIIQSYDPVTLEKMGHERAKNILSLMWWQSGKIDKTLEFGCGDGMVSCILQQRGKKTIGIDIRPRLFDLRASQTGVTFVSMDAIQLGFEDNYFDFSFSYNVFEHIFDPETALRELIRVTRPGGYIYLNFDPLYMSPLGAHANRVVNVPYCALLFHKKDLFSLAPENQFNFHWLNYWSLGQYEALWKRYEESLQIVTYYKKYDLSGLDLIIKYPSCFRSKTDNFENLVVSGIEILFKVKHPATSQPE